MKLDEAILHAREVAQRNRKAMNFESTDSIDDDIKINCTHCAEQHEQLAVWLEDLKRRREYDDELMGSGTLNNAYKSGYNRAIDDFVYKLKNSLTNNYRHFLKMDSDGFAWLTIDAVETHIGNVAEKLKTGNTHD